MPQGHRHAKFDALQALTLNAAGWQDCPTDGRAPFLPVSSGAWAAFPSLESLFVYNGSGVQAKRVWVIAPDVASLRARWSRLIFAGEDKKELLFHATLRDGKPADRHVRSVVAEGLPGFVAKPTRLVDETSECEAPIPFGFRSFDRQWIIPDPRVITQPNANLWYSRSPDQVYLTALSRSAPGCGPGISLTGLLPDLDHFKGSFGGRVYPLWSDALATRPNIPADLLAHLASVYAGHVRPEDLFTYIAALAAHPAYTERFRTDLATPGLRIPLNADATTFADAVALGRRVVWLHTFGERFADPAAGRPLGAPRLPVGCRPQVPKGGAIPLDAAGMPDSISYNAAAQRLQIGSGFIEPVPSAVWHYAVSGKQVLLQWFSYRRKNRERPLIGDRRPPSPLGDIQPDTWLAEYTTELLNVLNVLGGLVDLEPAQAALLERICNGPLIDDATLRQAGVFAVAAAPKRKAAAVAQGPDLLTDVPSLGA